MEISFDNWSIEKKKIDSSNESNFYVNTREIWFTKMWVNIWFEENWKDAFLRPILV